MPIAHSIRRRLLAAILAVMAAHGAKSATAESPDPAENAAIAAFVRRGGSFDLDAWGDVEAIYLSDCFIPSDEFAHLAGLRNLKVLTFFSCKNVTDEVWPHLANLKKLEKLALKETRITDEGIQNLSNLAPLKSLDLCRTSISDAGLKHVGQHRSLQSLKLIGTRITDKGMPYLANLRRLRSLELVGTKITDKGLESLANLKSLEELSLEGTSITNAGIEHISRLTKLRTLTIHNTEIDQDCLKYLENLNRLETLYLGVPVSDVGIESLRKLKSLEHLYLSGDLAEDRRAHIQNQLPNVGVY